MKILKRIVFIVFMTMIFLNKVNATCTYEEKQELSEESKTINAYFEADVSNNIFKFNLVNLSENLYVVLSNDINDTKYTIYGLDLKDGNYSYDEPEINKSGTYTLNIYSNKGECVGENISSRRIKKGVINKFAKQDVCKGLEEYYYCNSVLNTEINISDDEVYKKIEDYKNLSIEKNEVVEEKFNIKDFIKEHKMIFIIICSILFIIVVVVIIKIYLNKRKSKLL